MKTNLIQAAVAALTLAAAGYAQLSTSVQSYAQQLIEFDVPRAATVSSPVCAPLCGTVAYANNSEGAIVGSYTDKNVVPHGFLRTVDGNIISFDAPGAGLGAGLDQGTVAYSINDLGVIAGQFEDNNNVFHGFVRYSDGHFATFDAPGAGTGAGQGTLAYNINLEGATAGVYFDGNFEEHGFVRSVNGGIATFDPPGSVGTMVCEETCLNLEGQITGFYVDGNDTIHGFLREPDGTITTIDAPGRGTGAFQGTEASTTMARSQATSLTRTTYITAFCAPVRASSLHFMIRREEQPLARERRHFRSTPSERSRERSLTRTTCFMATRGLGREFSQ